MSREEILKSIARSVQTLIASAIVGTILAGWLAFGQFNWAKKGCLSFFIAYFYAISSIAIGKIIIDICDLKRLKQERPDHSKNSFLGQKMIGGR